MEEYQEEKKTKDDDIYILLNKNLEISEEILKLTKYIKQYVFWQKIFFWLKLAIIIIPIALAIIYLPPFLSGLRDSFQELVGGFNVLGDPSAIQNLMDK